MTISSLCKSYATALCVVGGLALSTAALANDPTKSHKSEHAAMMEMMDTNGDGKASSAEHAICAKKMFGKTDVDKDGKVTALEMDAAHKDMSATHHDSKAPAPKSAEMIKAFDTNKDGALTAQEHETGSRQMFGKMDVDKDGSLTSAEMKDWHKNTMASEE